MTIYKLEEQRIIEMNEHQSIERKLANIKVQYKSNNPRNLTKNLLFIKICTNGKIIIKSD